MKQSNPISIPLEPNPEGNVIGCSFVRLLGEPQFILQYIAKATRPDTIYAVNGMLLASYATNQNPPTCRNKAHPAISIRDTK